MAAVESLQSPAVPNGVATPKPGTPANDIRPVFFFDIDNCLYPRSYKIHDMMKVLIRQYFRTHLQLSESDATNLHQHYYTSYGLALSGLVRHHQIDVLEYNRLVDDSLPLETIIRPNPHLTGLLTDLRASRTCSKLWLFTNAYVNHALRVVRLLGIAHLFDGVTYCDYEEGARTGRLICKPDKEMFEKAMREAGVEGQPDRCYFIDDSALNCTAAEQFGWKTVHLLDPEDPEPQKRACKYQVRDLGELKVCFPELFNEEGERVARELGMETEGRVVGQKELEDRGHIEEEEELEAQRDY
ncbi:Haloacid dehalogenase-like hydrolase-domain-containing protein [Kalaharituber pfeilii]|nr:Haloacid dehalogenase-like hydrolase-domain-containing protein [Kalaharituber pfeilii]